MTLSSAISSAKSTFSNSGEQSGVISKNIANTSNANYVRRQAVIVTTMQGAQVITTERAQDEALQRQLFLSSSQSTAQDTLLSGLEQLKSVLGGNDYELAPSTYIATLYNSLQAYGSKPGELSLAQSVVTDAKDVANSLNTATKAIQDLRSKADNSIGTAVSDLNSLLGELKIANDKVVSLTATGGDPNDALDQRDTLVKSISEIVGLSVVKRENNDLVLYTSDGTTLFETVPRTVTFSPTIGYSSAITGNPVYIDGTPVEIGSGGNTTAEGKLPALLQLRDQVAPVFQKQIDEVARALVTVFSETDPNGVAADMPGLFTWSGGTTPAAGTLVDGIAGTIAVNPALVSSAGGDPQLLRDGGINGAAYVHNTTSGSGYSDLIDSYMTGLQADMAFDPSAELDGTSSLLTYATDSVGWLEDYRSSATSSSENKTAMLARSTQAYSDKTSVSLDEELSLLLDVEQSYKAATKLITAVDEMLQALIAIAG
ncbi:MAG: flagellar hook-associated protein FlgK [Allorhizobium sp.]